MPLAISGCGKIMDKARQLRWVLSIFVRVRPGKDSTDNRHSGGCGGVWAGTGQQQVIIGVG